MLGDKPKEGGAELPWVKCALSNKFLFADGEPAWKNIVSSKQASREREKVSRFLLKHAFVQPELANIGEKLGYCSHQSRCLSGACPECSRAFQRFFVSECQSLFEAKSTVIASIIDSRMSEHTDLERFRPKSLINRVKTILKDNAAELAVGGVDLSFNQDSRGSFEPHWSAHLWLLLSSRNRQLWERALHEANPASEATPRPVKVQKWDGRDEALAYAFKTTFGRRVSVWSKRKLTGQLQRNTSDQDLRVSERIPLYQWLDSTGLHSRLFSFGVRPTMTENGISFVKIVRRKQ